MAFMVMYTHALAQGLKLCGVRGSSGSIPEGGLVMGSGLARPVDRTWHVKCVYAADGGWQDGDQRGGLSATRKSMHEAMGSCMMFS